MDENTQDMYCWYNIMLQEEEQLTESQQQKLTELLKQFNYLKANFFKQNLNDNEI